MLTDEEKREIDDLAMKFPSWQKHLQKFREKHPELKPQEVMKKAGFTFRMKKGKLINAYLKPKFQKIMDEVTEDG